MKTATAFKSQQTNKTWKIFLNTNRQTEYTIYLMECTICNLQYVGKNGTSFYIRFNNHRKDIKDPKAILAGNTFKKTVVDLTNT